jgi:hypothetical protein
MTGRQPLLGFTAPHPALRATLSPEGRGVAGARSCRVPPSPLRGEGGSRSEPGEGPYTTYGTNFISLPSWITTYISPSLSSANELMGPMTPRLSA